MEESRLLSLVQRCSDQIFSEVTGPDLEGTKNLKDDLLFAYAACIVCYFAVTLLNAVAYLYLVTL